MHGRPSPRADPLDVAIRLANADPDAADERAVPDGNHHGCGPLRRLLEDLFPIAE